jgi:hypothetical protein
MGWDDDARREILEVLARSGWVTPYLVAATAAAAAIFLAWPYLKGGIRRVLCR